MTPLRAAIIEAGYAENEYLLSLNMAIEDPNPRFRRSRMFKWPVSISRLEDRLTVASPLMLFEPFVQRVMATLKTPCDHDPDTPGGLNTQWHHAVDTTTDLDYLDLIKTAAYTTPGTIARGVSINVMSQSLSTTNARRVLAAIEIPEPGDRSASALTHGGGMLVPAFIDDGVTSGKRLGRGRWAVNLRCRDDCGAEAWAAVHGVEDGWFTRSKYGYHYMSPTGMFRHMRVPLP